MRRTAAIAYLLALAIVAVAAPRLGLRDPLAQPDGLVLRELAPGARVDAILLADGTKRYADEWTLSPAGDVLVRRGTRWESIERERLAGSIQGDWHRRERFLAGTDIFGRDLLSRLVYGARVSLLVGGAAAAIALVLGAAVGLTCALGGRFVDGLLMRATDLFLAIPRLFLALLIVVLWKPSLTTTVAVLAATTWMPAARLVRGELFSIRERTFVEAARAAGATRLRIGLRHLFPATVAPLAIETAMRVGDTILLESTLSFLGLGVPAPMASWGNLIADGRSSLLGAWWVSTLPGLAVAATVVALNVAGDPAREPDRPRGGRRVRELVGGSLAWAASRPDRPRRIA